MMRDSRRQSPESSRRRRRDHRRDSHENLAFVPPQPMNSSMPQSSAYPNYPSQYPTPSATAPTRARGAGPSDVGRDRDGNIYGSRDEIRDGNRYGSRDEVRDGNRYGSRDEIRDGNRDRDRDQYREPVRARQYANRQRAASDSSGSFTSSSAASSLIDISRHYPAQSRFGGLFGTFFGAPSERRVRRRRSGRAKKRRVLYFGNSSSSSVNSDLAYGTGYIPKTKGREFNKLRKVSGGHSTHQTRDRDGRNANEYDRAGAGISVAAGSSSRQGGPKKDKTDEEILALGRQLSDFAKKQKEHDQRTSGKVKATGLLAAAAAVNEVRKKRRDAKTRGIATSRPHGDYSDSSDDSDWEDAPDDQGGFSDAESALAYGSVVSHALRPTRSGMTSALGVATGAALGAGVASTTGRSGTSTRPAESLPATNVRKSSVVDPRLFGPYNSLRGMINTPCGFGEGQPTADHQQFNKLRRAETEPIYKGPMKNVYPVPTSDPDNFDADAAPTMSSRQELPYRSRPAPIPLQQPSPKAPVSSKVYQAEKLEEESQKHSRTRSDETGVGAGTKLTGIAAAAAAAVALASDRKSKRDSRRDERRKERKDNDTQEVQEFNRVAEPWEGDRGDRSKRRDRDAESEVNHRSKRDSYSSKYSDERDHKRHSRREEDATPRKRRETRVDHYPEAESSRKPKRSEKGDRDRDFKSEVSRSSQRDSRNIDDRDERRRDEQNTRDQMPGAYDYIPPPADTTTRQPVDPFQFQVTDGALGTSLVSAAMAPTRPLTPTVVTVDREPNFDDPPLLEQSDTRLSRKDSFEMERMAEEYNKGARNYLEGKDSRRHDYEERGHEARTIYEEAKHSTAPIAAAAAVVSAVAMEMDRSTDHRRNGYVDDESRDYSKSSKDPVQEEADRYYREKMTAEKNAAEEQQSRSVSSDKSVIGKYDDDGQKQPYTIVTPPDMEGNKTSVKSPYEGPDADVRIDNKIYPKELHRFQSRDRDSNSFLSRDPSCERERPMLNLVYPTPVPSRQPTPSLSRGSSGVGEKPTSADEDKGKKKKKKTKKNKSISNDGSTEDYFGGAKSETGASGAASTVSSSAKSVTWGENSTKSFEVESPGPRSEDDIALDKSESGDRSRPVLNQTSQWGMIAAAIAGSSAEPADEPKVKASRSKKASSDVGVGYRDRSTKDVDDLMDDARSEPPIPGPKPVSLASVKMPGGFEDDIEFAATLAAGLKDTGFDPSIVIDDPEYRRRDSPPHTSDTNGDGWNGSSFADVVTDMTSKQKGVSDPGFFSEPVDMTREDPTGPSDVWTEPSHRLSKKEKKRLEKEAKRQSVDITGPVAAEVLETGAFEDVPERQLLNKEQRKRDEEARVEEKVPDASMDKKELYQNDDYNSREAVTNPVWEEPDKRKKSKKDRKSRDLEDDTSTRVSRTDSFDSKSTIRVVNQDDEWDAPRKSKSKSKRDSGGSEIVSRSAPGSEVGEREAHSKRSSRSAPGSEVGVRESSSKQSSSKSRHRSGTDFDDYRDDPPDRKRDPWDDRDVSSVVSESRGDDRRKERRGKRSSLYDDDDAKSVASAPGSSRKGKRSSLYEDEDAARSTVSLSGSPRRSRDKEADKSEKRSSGLFASIFKKDGKDDSKKLDRESFLDNAGTLGAGVGLATAAAAVAASVSRSKAAQASSEKDSDAVDIDEYRKSKESEDFDPEIVPRAIKPAIDPQYGDLLPLPPSEPGSPKSLPEDLPTLPDSRPDTPTEERALKLDLLTHRRRRSTQDTPAKSPSSTAIPISLRLGQRHGAPPSSPIAHRSPPPNDSPVTTPESSRRSARISWDSSREIKPLYLLEHSRHGSLDHIPQMDLPALPPSEPSEPPSRESPAPGHADLYTNEDVAIAGIPLENLAASGLRIDTDLASSAPIEDMAGSQETTPKAIARPELPLVSADHEDDPAPVDSMSKDRSSYLLNSAPSSTKSNKTVKSEESMRSQPESTPTKHPMAETSLPDAAEDMTSADEHFSDALEGTHSDTFEEARGWFDKAQPPEPVAAEMSMPTAEPAVGPMPPVPVVDAEPDEWKNMSAKERKKAKKARKSKELSLKKDVVAGAATAAVVASLLTDEPTKIEEAAEPVLPQEKEKSLSVEDELAETMTQPMADNVVPDAAADISHTDAAKDSATTADIEVDKPEQDFGDPAPIVTDDAKEEALSSTVDTTIHEAVENLEQDLAPEIVPESSQDAVAIEPTAGADSREASSKKGKKKKKKSKDISSHDTVPTAEATPDLGADATLEPIVDALAAEPRKQQETEATITEPLDLNMSAPVETTTETTKSLETVEAKEFHGTAIPPGEESTAAHPEEITSYSISEKDEKNLQMDEPVITEKEPEIETPRDREQIEELKTERITGSAMEQVAISGGEITTAEDLPTLDQVIGTAQPAFDFVSSESKTTKDEEPLPVERNLDPPSTSGEQAPVETIDDDRPSMTEAFAIEDSTAASQEAVEDVEANEPEIAPLLKSKKKKKKGKQLVDSSPEAMEPETLPIMEELPVVELPVTEETASTAQELAVSAEAGEDEFAPVSKNKKKKKKSKGTEPEKLAQAGKELDTCATSDDQPPPAELALTEELFPEQSATSEGPAEPTVTADIQTAAAILSDQTITTGPSSIDQSVLVSKEPIAAAESEFAPVSSKSKKTKKKGFQLGDSVSVDNASEVLTVSEDQFESAKLETDLPVDTEVPVTEASTDSQPITEATEDDFAPVTKGKKNKKNKKKPIQLEESFPGPVSQTIEAAPAAKASEDAMILEKLTTNRAGEVQQQLEKQSRSLDTQVSEPLFSQDEVPLESTQDGAMSVEPTQTEKSVISENTLEDTEDFGAETVSSKKKGKKNKKKSSQASAWDLLEEKQAEEAIPDPVSTSAETEALDKSKEEPVAEVATEVSRDLSEDKPAEIPTGEQVEDKQSTTVTGKKSKKKKKDSKSSSAPETDSSSEIPVNMAEPFPFTEEPASIEETKSTAEPEPEPELQTAGSTPQTIEEELPQPAGKKNKKKKKRSSMVGEPMEEDSTLTEPSTETETTPEIVVDEPAPAADPEAEFEVPKKGKKNKKKKNSLSPELTEVEPSTAPEATTQSMKQAIADNHAATLETPTFEPEGQAEEKDVVDMVNTDEQPPAETKPIDMMSVDNTMLPEALRDMAQTTGPTVETSSMKNVDDLVPVKLAKKDKKKRKKQAGLEESVQGPEPEFVAESKAMDAEALTDVAYSAETSDGLASAAQTPMETVPVDQTKEMEAIPEDMWAGFSSKQSKKDKKKKKAKNGESELTQQTEPTPATDLTPEPIQEYLSKESSEVANDFGTTDSTFGPGTPRDSSGAANDEEVVKDEKEVGEAKDNDERLIGKKDKKKKKKARALDMEADVSSRATEETPVSEEPETKKAEEVGGDDSWTDTVSKKEKKKNKKAKQGSQYDDLPPQNTPIQDADNPYDADARPEAEKVDPLEPATTAQNIGVTEVSDAAPRDVTFESHQATADVQAETQETQEPKDMSMPPDSQPPQPNLDVAESSAAITSEDCTIVQDASAQPSGDPDVPVAVDEPADDEWSMPITGKKAKKGKKNRKSQVDSMFWDEPTAGSSSLPTEDKSVPESGAASFEPVQPITPDEMVDCSTTDREADLVSSAAEQAEATEFPSHNVDVYDTQAMADLPLISSTSPAEHVIDLDQGKSCAADDSWQSTPQRKLSKKDKRKKKKQQVSLADQPEDESQETTSGGDNTPAEPADPVAASLNEPVESPIIAEDITAEPEERLPINKSKEDQKKTAAATLAATALAAAGITATIATLGEEHDSLVAEEPVQFEGSRSWADEMEDEAASTPAEQKPVIGTLQEVDDVSFLASKEVNKGEKSKSKQPSSGDFSTVEPTPTAETGPEAIPEATPKAVEPAVEEAPVHEILDAGGEWAIPSKKKAKKGKKSKSGSGTLTPAEPALTPEDTIREPTPTILQASTDPAASPDPVEDNDLSKETNPPVPEDAGDEWAVRPKKKGKKGKKSKTSSGTMTPAEPAGDEGAPETMDPITEFAPTQLMKAELAAKEGETTAAVGVDDEWAVPSKKKSKQGKKDKSSSATATPVNESGIVLPDLQSEALSTTNEAMEPHGRALGVDSVSNIAEPVEPTKTFEPEELPHPTDDNDAEDWGSAVAKKDKKGKKSEAGSGTMTPIMPLDETPVQLPRDEQLAPEQEPKPTTEEPAAIKLPDAVEDSSMTLSTFDELPNTTSVVGAGTLEDRGLHAMEIDTISAENADQNREHGVSETRGFGNILGASAEGQDFGTRPEVVAENAAEKLATVTTEAEPNETWAVPVKKKSKKEKKRKSSQVVLDAPLNDPVVEEKDLSFTAAEAQPEEAADDEWPDDFSVPKSKKKKGKKAAAEAPAGSVEKKALQSFEETATGKNIACADDVSSRDATGPASSDRHAGENTLSRNLGDQVKDNKAKSQPGLSTTDALATAGAIAGGVAVLAEKFGGGKKKTKGKQKKIVDKRQPQDDDMFDDPALWEGADKKALDDGKDAELHENFWGGAADEEEEGNKDKEVAKGVGMLEVANTRELKHVLPGTMSGSFTESDGGWTETPQHGVPLSDEFAENPILGRGEAAALTMSKEPTGLLRRSAGVGEPVGGLLKERSDPEPTLQSMGSESDFRRSPSRGLPSVQEVPEAEAIAAQYNWPTPEMNRDSGFAPESPTPRRRRSITSTDDQQRDSGVHTDDYSDGKMQTQTQTQTPDVSTKKRLRHSPSATPVLTEPEAAVAPPEPEKKDKKAKRSATTTKTKDYGEAASMGGVAAGVAAAATGAGIGLAAKAATEKATAGQRSVSDNPYIYASGSLPSLKAAAAATATATPTRGPDGQDLSSRAEPVARRSVSNSSLSRQHTPEPLRLRPESPGITGLQGLQGLQGLHGLQGLRGSTPTPPLRRVDKRMSGDLRALRQRRNSSSTSSTPTSAPAIATATDSQVLPPPVANESRVRSKGEERDMADVYDGYGEGRIGSPRSPTRPHSMRRRQSMQVLELESRVEQLMAENRMLTEARTHAEQNLSQKAASVLSERDSEIESLKQSLHFLQNEVARLTEVNEGLTSANAELASKDSGRYADMTRELDEARGAHTTFTQSLRDRDAEIADLRAKLEEAKDQVRQMQRKILESKAGDAGFLNIKDEDYFDHRCQQLCSHVQQWVLRFSKFSDMRACRLTSEINDEKTIDRLDNAVLDGTDVDTYLRDRVRRRDIFMAMSMNMIWEFVFTRYLFGMDREQRQKLKSLEKLLTEVGPAQAVRQWRAVTLTLLSKRASFKDQRDLDTEAVVQAIYQTLCKILPPPSNLEGQIQSQLRRVMHEAVDLSVEMRTQRAEYMMLPPLQPEYDADGELAATVSFDAAMMNERSGSTNMTNEELESQGSVVRIVLFPLVVKRGDDDGIGEEKIVVCPAQVLISRDDKGRRHYTPSSEAGGASLGARSRISLVTESMGQPEA
ncbi:involucrin repeat protein, partial [Metarhizium brunneum ARSEF 3297]